MKNKSLLLVGGVCFLSHALFAQHQQPLIPAPSVEAMVKGDFFSPSSDSRQEGHNALKPTVNKQRMIASAIRNDSTGTLSLTDSALYTYSNMRGSHPSALTGNIATLSDFDTAHAYISADQFAVPVGRASGTYDANNRSTTYNIFNNDGSLAQKTWHEYNTDTVTKSGSLRNVSPGDFIYDQTEFNAIGQITFDTFSQVVPSMPNSGYNWNANTSYEYDANHRVSYYHRVTNTDGTGGGQYTNRIWHLYASAAQQVPYKDSAILTLPPLGGSPSADHLSITQYSYDASNNLLQATIYAEPGDVLNYRATKTYTASNKLLTQLDETYSNNQWIADDKTENEYTNDVLTKTTYSTFNNIAGVWSVVSKTVYHLNSLLLVDSMAFYNSGLTATNTYTYNSYNNIVEQKETSYDNNGAATVNLTHNYYDIFDDGTTAINSVAKNELNAAIYPNPFTDNIYISIPSFKNDATILVCNLNGSVIDKMEMHTSKTTIDFSGYPKGIYFIKINSAQGMAVKKVVKH